MKDRCKTVRKNTAVLQNADWYDTMAGTVLARMPPGGLSANMCTDNSRLRERFAGAIVKYGERVASFLLQGKTVFVKYLKQYFLVQFLSFVLVRLVSDRVVE